MLKISAKNINPRLILDLFITVNLAFLAVDVYLAHASNSFAHRAEWLPFYFSMIASLLVAVSLWWQSTVSRWLYRLVGWGGIVIGTAGLLYHLDSRFFIELTLKSLVYTAPFVAPLAFSGLGLLILLNDQSTDNWGWWVVVIAGCGWCGNFLLAVLDHAQNGFFVFWEWLPVAGSALACGCLATVIYRPAGDHRFCLWVLGVNCLLGIVGLFFHLSAGLHSGSFIHSAPIFAPLLFPNLAILATIGIWKL